MDQMKEEHENWKQEFAQNLYFNSKGEAGRFFGMCSQTYSLLIKILPVRTQNYSQLDMFLIYFDTATFDQIQKDTKMKMETTVGVTLAFLVFSPTFDHFPFAYYYLILIFSLYKN
jgi:hypothetical protein